MAEAPVRLHAELPALSSVDVLRTGSWAEVEEPHFIDPAWFGPRMRTATQVTAEPAFGPYAVWLVQLAPVTESSLVAEHPAYLVFHDPASGTGHVLLAGYARYIDALRALEVRVSADHILLSDRITTDGDDGGMETWTDPVARLTLTEGGGWVVTPVAE